MAQRHGRHDGSAGSTLAQGFPSGQETPILCSVASVAGVIVRIHVLHRCLASHRTSRKKTVHRGRVVSRRTEFETGIVTCGWRRPTMSR